MYITAQGPVSEMTYTVSSGTLNSSIPYHTIPYHTIGYQPHKNRPLHVLSYCNAKLLYGRQTTVYDIHGSLERRTALEKLYVISEFVYRLSPGSGLLQQVARDNSLNLKTPTKLFIDLFSLHV